MPAPPIDVPEDPWFLTGWIIYISLFALIIVLLLWMMRNEKMKDRKFVALWKIKERRKI